MSSTGIIITGAKGRMGQTLIACAERIPELKVVAKIDLGDDRGTVIADYGGKELLRDVEKLRGLVIRAREDGRYEREAERLGLNAALSHSCYDPLPDGKHCGKCDACRLRAKGFAEAGISDPTVYA